MSGEGRKTLEQKRAAHAWKQVLEVKKGTKDEKKSFMTQIKKTPIRIVSAGLGQALAFLQAKGYAPHLRNALTDWTNRRLGKDGNKDLLQRIIHGDSEFLRRATAESLAYLEWMVRFAEAEGLSESEGEEA